MSAAMGFGLVAFVIYVPAACLTTLGLLAAWNKWHPPGLRQVLVATALVAFLPLLVFQLIDLVESFNAPLAGYRMWLALGVAISGYVPVLVPAVLWALQRRDEDGRFSRTARVAGSLLVAYVILVILVLPVAFFGFVFLFQP